MNETTIYLTTPEALMFREYQQFHQTFALLCSKGVFDTKSGSITIHFDHLGVIQKIERHDSLFDSRNK